MGGYDFCGDDAYYTPTGREKFLIKDAILGILDDDDFVQLYTTPPTLRPLTDAKLAECMLAVDEPMQWGRLGSDGGTNMMRKTMRAIERALAEANGMTLEPITSAASPNA